LEIVGLMPRRPSPNLLVCAPYLHERHYPACKNELMQWFCDGGNDVGGCVDSRQDDPQFHLGLLCVNNCLAPAMDARGFNRWLGHRDVEAHPLECFADGYHAGTGVAHAMASSLTTVYDIAEGEAASIADSIMEAFAHWNDAAVDAGHCIQICVPNTLEALDVFVHLSPAYGSPVTVYRDAQTHRDFAVETFSPLLTKVQTRAEGRERQRALAQRIAASEPVSVREVLSSRDMALLQARIIGHPNLFIHCGARARFFSADPSFDLDACFGDRIRAALLRLSDRRRPRALCLAKMRPGL
jgi:hypothetical protein